MLSVAQVCELAPGDANNATWINPGFSGVVREITTKLTKAKKNFWPCIIQDHNGEECIEVSFFTAPKFREGDTVEIHGKGLRRTEFNGKPQAAIGRETVVDVVHGSRERAPAPQPRAAGPRDDSRGGGEEQHHAPQQQEDAPPSTPANPQFHHKMGATALFYLHCLAYARKINVTLKAGGHPEMSPDHFQACVSTLFIAGDRNGLAVASPPPSSKATEAAPPAKVKPRRYALQPKHEDEDEEDVPF